MFEFLRGAQSRAPTPLPLFPLKTVLFPGGMLPLKVFEQRYIEMSTACLKDDKPFGVCVLTRGEEVAQRGRTPEFAAIGTLARILRGMPQLGILHLRTEGGGRFRVQSHGERARPRWRRWRRPRGPSGARSAQTARRAARPADIARRTRELHRRNRARRCIVGKLSAAELLPLPLAIASMLEINDCEVRPRSSRSSSRSRACCERGDARVALI